MKPRKETLTLADFPMISTIDLEKQVLAGVIVSSELLIPAKDMLGEDDFSSPEARNIWKTLCGMEESGEPINASTVFSKVGRSEYLIDVVGRPDNPWNSDDMVAVAHMLHNAAIKARAYIDTLELLRTVTSPESTDDEMFSKIQKLQDSLRDTESHNEVVSISEACDQLSEEIAKRKRGEIVCVPSGISKLDEELKGGFESEELVILAARPSVGKTALALQILKSAAASGTETAVFSLEMSNSSLVKRLMTSTGSVSSWQLATGNIGSEEFQYASSWLRRLPISFCDTAFSIEQIESKLTRLWQRGKAGFAVIDYLGLIGGGNGTTTYNQVTDVSRRLKLLAKKLHIPILLLAQLNRSAASEGRHVQLFDLRDSGAIEQDADIVLMLENPDVEFLNEAFPQMATLYSERLNELVLMWIRKIRRGQRDSAILFETSREYTCFDEVRNDKMNPFE